MSKSRASSAVALVAHLPEVEVLAPAPDTAPASVGKVETLVDQGVVDAFLNAEGAVTETALALFYACTLHAVSPQQFVGRSDAKVRASEFNVAQHVAKIMGSKGARGVILKASQLPGDKRGNVLAALRATKKIAVELKPSAIKGAALNKEIEKRADVAAKAASSKDAARQAARTPRQPTGPKIPASGSWGAFFPTAMAAMLDIQKTLTTIELPKNKLALAKGFADALAEAIEAAEALRGGA